MAAASLSEAFATRHVPRIPPNPTSEDTMTNAPTPQCRPKPFVEAYLEASMIPDSVGASGHIFAAGIRAGLHGGAKFRRLLRKLRRFQPQSVMRGSRKPLPAHRFARWTLTPGELSMSTTTGYLAAECMTATAFENQPSIWTNSSCAMASWCVTDV